MKFSINISSMLEIIKNSIRRFPVTILVSTTFVVLLIMLLEKGSVFSFERSDMLGRVIMTVALGMPLSVNIKLIFEKIKNTNPLNMVIGYGIGAIVLILYYFIFLNELNWISIAKYIGLSIFLYLGFFYIPWISKKEGFEYYVIDVLNSFIVTLVYSAVLFLGIVIILFTIVQLFNVQLPDNLILYSFIVIAGIFAPALFLAKIPLIEKDNYKITYLKSLKVLLLYIVIPLITVYTLILYAYFLKIIISRDWPQGLVSHLVLWYSLVSAGVIFLITPLLDENKWAYRFKKLFPIIILPILAMMFMAIGIRVNQYGITEFRYFGILLGLWVLGIMLYFIFKKKLKNIVIAVSLSILVLISVFGPLSGFTISKFSQNNRFESILEKNQMLEANEIKQNSNISKEDKEEISMILNYFDSKHSLDDIKYLHDGFNMNGMETVFGFPYTDKDLYSDNYFSYYISPEDKIAIDVKEYDYFVDGVGHIDLIGGNIEFENANMTYNDNNIIIEKDSEILYQKDLTVFLDEIVNENEFIEGRQMDDLNPEDLIFIDENDDLKIKIIISSFSGRTSNDENIIDYIEYYILVRIK